MAIDFVLAPTPEEAGTRRAGASIGEAAHAEVWSDPSGTSLPAPRSRRGSQAGRFPLLMRLADPYSDAVFAVQELSLLIAEIQLVLAFPHLSQATARQLRALAALANQAVAEASSLYAFGD